jgi:hypothetical protein
MPNDTKNMTRHDVLQYGISGAALLFSALALLIAIMELRAARDQLNADVWPYLQVGISPSASGLEIVFSNRGMGPAVVRRAVIEDGDGGVAIDLASPNSAQWRPFFPSGSDVELSATWTQGRAISPDEDVTVIEIRATPDDGVERENVVSARDLLEMITRHPVEVCFCSITGDCWSERSDSPAGPEAVPVCEPVRQDDE